MIRSIVSSRAFLCALLLIPILSSTSFARIDPSASALGSGAASSGALGGAGSGLNLGGDDKSSDPGKGGIESQTDIAKRQACEKTITAVRAACDRRHENFLGGDEVDGKKTSCLPKKLDGDVSKNYSDAGAAMPDANTSGALKTMAAAHGAAAGSAGSYGDTCSEDKEKCNDLCSKPLEALKQYNQKDCPALGAFNKYVREKKHSCKKELVKRKDVSDDVKEKELAELDQTNDQLAKVAANDGSESDGFNARAAMASGGICDACENPYTATAQKALSDVDQSGGQAPMLDQRGNEVGSFPVDPQREQMNFEPANPDEATPDYSRGVVEAQPLDSSQSLASNPYSAPQSVFNSPSSAAPAPAAAAPASRAPTGSPSAAQAPSPAASPSSNVPSQQASQTPSQQNPSQQASASQASPSAAATSPAVAMTTPQNTMQLGTGNTMNVGTPNVMGTPPGETAAGGSGVAGTLVGATEKEEKKIDAQDPQMALHLPPGDQGGGVAVAASAGGVSGGFGNTGKGGPLPQVPASSAAGKPTRMPAASESSGGGGSGGAGHTVSHPWWKPAFLSSFFGGGSENSERARGANVAGQVDLRKFLPGQTNDPNETAATRAAQGIHGPNTFIWSAVKDRYKALDSTLPQNQEPGI